MLSTSHNIAFTGLAGSGKSTAAEYCVQVGKYNRRSLARPIRDLLLIQNPLLNFPDGHMLLHMALALNGGWQGIKQHPHFGPQVRRLLQVTGTEWGRATHPALWLNVEESALDAELPDWWKSGPDNPRVCWDDVRFDNEALWVRQHGGAVIEITRPQAPTKQERHAIPAQKTHASEAGISPALVSFRVVNTTLNELHGQLDAILKEINNNVRS